MENGREGGRGHFNLPLFILGTTFHFGMNRIRKRASGGLKNPDSLQPHYHQHSRVVPAHQDCTLHSLSVCAREIFFKPNITVTVSKTQTVTVGWHQHLFVNLYVSFFFFGSLHLKGQRVCVGGEHTHTCNLSHGGFRTSFLCRHVPSNHSDAASPSSSRNQNTSRFALSTCQLLSKSLSTLVWLCYDRSEPECWKEKKN